MWLTSLLPGRSWDSRRHHHGRARRCPAPQRRSTVPRLEVLEARTVLSPLLTVTNNTDDPTPGSGSLRATIAAAPSGATIEFAKGIHTITLTNGELQITQDLDIEGPGANRLTISGNDSSRIFDISGAPTVKIAGLTITDGLADSSAPQGSLGGGIFNDAGTLTLTDDVVSDNRAIGNSGVFTGISTSMGSAAGGLGFAAGGGIFNQSGTLTVTHSTLIANQALGGTGGTGGGGGSSLDAALGGGIYILVGGVKVDHSTLAYNKALGGSGGSGSAGTNFIDYGAGGGIYNSDGDLQVDHSTVAYNQAIGGSDSSDSFGIFPGSAEGGGIFNFNFDSTIDVTNSTFDHNQVIGGNFNSGNNPGVGTGGGLANGGKATVSDDTFTDNLAHGGHNNLANLNLGSTSVVPGVAFPDLLSGVGWGGGINNHNGPVNVSDSTFSGNQARGGDDNTADNTASPGVPFVGAGIGGGLVSDFGGMAIITYSAFTGNLAQGGVGAGGSNGGDGLGGGLYSGVLMCGRQLDAHHHGQCGHSQPRPRRPQRRGGQRRQRLGRRPVQ